MSRLELIHDLPSPARNRPADPSGPREGGGEAPRQNEAGAAIRHVAELMRQSRRLILLLMLACAALSCAYAVYKLNFSPVYRASAKVTAQPTDAELRYSQVYVRSSSLDSANVITRSHIEYLKSREIAERARLEVFGAAGAAPEEQQIPALLAFAKEAKQQVEAGLRWLNSGSAGAAAGEKDLVTEIQDAIELKMVESSFVMEISVAWEDPKIAAELANVLARVYRARSREQVAATTGELASFLETQKLATERRLSDLIDERNALRTASGVVEIETERRELLARLFAESAQRDADRRSLLATQAQLRAFLPDRPLNRHDGLTQTTKEELNLSRLREVELAAAVVESDKIVTRLEQRIAALAKLETRFEGLNSEIERTRVQLDDIDARLLEVRISEAESIETLRIVDLAKPPALPEEPKVVNRTVMGAVSGFLLAMMVVLSRDYMATRLRTQTDLSGVAGLRVLSPAALEATELTGAAASPAMAAAEEDMRPYLDWDALDTDDMVAVLDVSDPRRAEAVGRRVMQSYPYSDQVHTGLLRRAVRPGNMPPSAAVLITLGRDELSAAELRDYLDQLRNLSRSLPVAVAYVDIRGRVG